MDTLVTIGLIIIFILLVVRFVGFLFKPVDQTIEKMKNQANTRQCPFCKSDVPKDAIVCKYCRREIEPIQPEKEMTPQDYVIRQEKRMETINKVLDDFRSKYPEVNFQYDTTLADIIINVPHIKKEEINQKDIQLKLIDALTGLGIDAKARFLSLDRINTAGFVDRLLEEVSVENQKKE